MPENKQNPQIEEIEVGIKEIKSLKVYPLSIGQQMKVSDAVSETLTKFFSQKPSEVDNKVVSFFLDFLKKNIEEAMGFVLDPKEMGIKGYADVKAILFDMSNDQFIDLVEKVYKNNFERAEKNLRSLFKNILKIVPEMGNTSVSKGQSQESVISIQDTD